MTPVLRDVTPRRHTVAEARRVDRDASGCSLCSPSRSWSPGHTAHLLGCASRPEPSQLSRRGLPSLAAPAGSAPALDSTTAPSCFLHGTFYTRWVFGLLISSSPLPDLAACDSESHAGFVHRPVLPPRARHRTHSTANSDPCGPPLPQRQGTWGRLAVGSQGSRRLEQGPLHVVLPGLGW